MKLKQLKEYFSFNQKEINNKHTIAVKIVEPTHYIVPYQMLYVLPTKIFSVIDNFLLFVVNNSHTQQVLGMNVDSMKSV